MRVGGTCTGSDARPLATPRSPDRWPLAKLISFLKVITTFGEEKICPPGAQSAPATRIACGVLCLHITRPVSVSPWGAATAAGTGQAASWGLRSGVRLGARSNIFTSNAASSLSNFFR